jgi:hypothetical protein
VARVERFQQRGQNDPSARPLPSFEMPWLEVVDPDRTLKRHAVRATPRVALSAGSTEEICVEDVLEVANIGALLPPGAESTQEIAAEDVLGVVHLQRPTFPSPRAYPSPRITEAPAPFPVHRADLSVLETRAPSSIAPVAIDAFSRSHADSTFLLEDSNYGLKLPRMGLAVAAGLGAIVGVFVLVLALGSAGAKPVVQMGAHSAPATLQVKPAAPPQVKVAGAEAHSAVPTVDVSSLPRAPIGTVSLATAASGHRLFIDGSLVKTGSAIVSCGKHLVKVGSKGRTESVDVPCGSEVVVGR